MAQKTYIGIDGKKYCSICNQAGFMGPKDKWRCRSPECDKIVREETRRLNTPERRKQEKLWGNIFSITLILLIVYISYRSGCSWEVDYWLYNDQSSPQNSLSALATLQKGWTVVRVWPAAMVAAFFINCSQETIPKAADQRNKSEVSRVTQTRWQTSDSLSWCASQAWGHHGPLMRPGQCPTSPRQ